jgi:hypothetical protein
MPTSAKRKPSKGKQSMRLKGKLAIIRAAASGMFARAIAI